MRSEASTHRDVLSNLLNCQILIPPSLEQSFKILSLNYFFLILPNLGDLIYSQPGGGKAKLRFSKILDKK